MPIVGLTDNIVEAFPKIGRLRKGAKKTQKDRPGPDLTYFRFTSERPEVEAAFYKAYGKEPRRISVVLPEPTADENFTTSKEEWIGSMTLLHRCDGVHIVRQFNKETGEYENFPPGEGPPCPYSEAGGETRTEKNPGCTNRGRLRVVIPELVAAGYVGTVTFGTGGKHDIRSILAVLKKVESARRQKGLDLAWMPFVLYRAEEEVSSPAWEGETPDKRHKVTKSLVKIVPAENWVKAQIAQVQAGYAPLLASGDVENGGNEYIEVDEETGEILETEEEAPPPFAEDGGSAEEPEAEEAKAADFPEMWAGFSDLAIQDLGYKTRKHVAVTLKENGVWPVSDKDGRCNFTPADGWAVLQGAQ